MLLLETGTDILTNTALYEYSPRVKALFIWYISLSLLFFVGSYVEIIVNGLVPVNYTFYDGS